MSEKNEGTVVKMFCVGPDRYEGELGADGITVHVHSTSPIIAYVALWMPYGFGRNPCGSGGLSRMEDGAWTGEATDLVNNRRWHLSGDFESGELMFQATGKPGKAART